MAVLQEYKCPCCGGAISFDSESQKMKCPFCSTEFDVETLKGYDDILHKDGVDKMEWKTDAGSEWQGDESGVLRTYVCKSCGGEIVTEETTAAASCPFCGNPIVMMDNFKGMHKPDLVIPFKLDKKAAKEGFKKHLSGKRLLPKAFLDENHIDEIKGVYVPFWLFDADADASIRYRATNTRVWSDSDYDYTETSYFAVMRDGTLSFRNVPADGSKKMADDLMESIEPYNFEDAVDFKTAYLAGYLADKYDVTAEESIPRANERVKISTADAFAATVTGYDSVTPETSSIRLENGKTKYALLPVWVMTTTWNGRKFTFAMNGQTGKFVGNLPVDKKAARKWLLGLTLGVGAGVWALMWIYYLLTVL